eukprot:jgi/Tetstr1/429206/TSEL_019158.t1
MPVGRASRAAAAPPEDEEITFPLLRSGATAGSDSATPTASTAMTITADHHTPIPPRLRALKLSVEVASSSGSFRKEREVLVTESVIGENGFAPELEEYLRAQRQEARKATGSSVMGAVFNVVNLFMGVALLSIVYAVAQGGWLSFVPLLAAGMVMCLSALLLGLCLDEMGEGQSPSYPELATHTWGSPGRVVAVVFCFLELFGNACMNLIVMWHEVESLMGALPGGGLLGLSVHNSTVLLGVVAIMPLLLTGNLKTLSYLSFVGILCTVVVTVVVSSLVVVDPGRNAFPPGEAPGHEVANPKGALLGIGIFSIALSQHSALPTLRNSLADPSQFRTVMMISMSVLVFLFAAMGASGYYYFGTSAHEIITSDLQITWIGKVKLFPGFSMNSVLVLMVAIQGLCSIPPGIAVLQDMLLDIFFASEHNRVGYAMATATRFLLFGALAGLSYTAFYVLGAVEGLIGGMCSMTCSLLLPVLLYATLAWRRLSILKRVALGALIVLSVLILLLVVTASLLAMLAPEDDSSNALLSAGQAGKPLQGVAFVKLYFDRLQGAT